jgi:hypothetical protein
VMKCIDSSTNDILSLSLELDFFSRQMSASMCIILAVSDP